MWKEVANKYKHSPMYNSENYENMKMKGAFFWTQHAICEAFVLRGIICRTISVVQARPLAEAVYFDVKD